MANQGIIVSVCCITFNHEKYICDTIEGFLMQETDFPIEIIIHDDASTDSTQNIIRKYAEKDDRIIPILREKNIKSTGVPVYPITFEKARGKYIAMCEGDDYWTDPLKLQKQVEFMEENEELAGCFHACKILYQESNEVEIRKLNIKKIFTLGYWLKKEIFATTGSLLFKSEVPKKIPEWANNIFAGDFILTYLILVEGYMGYIDNVMSVYRKGVPGSWSKQTLTQKRIEREYSDNIFVLAKINEMSDYKYADEVIQRMGILHSNYLNRVASLDKKSLIIKVYLLEGKRIVKSTIKKLLFSN